MRPGIRNLSTLALLLSSVAAAGCAEDPNAPSTTIELEVSPGKIEVVISEEAAAPVRLVVRTPYKSKAALEQDVTLEFSSSNPAVATLATLTPRLGFDNADNCGAATCYDAAERDEADIIVACHSVGTATIEIHGEVRAFEHDTTGGQTDASDVDTTSFSVKCIAKTSMTGCDLPGAQAVGQIGDALDGDGSGLCAALVTEVDADPTVHSSNEVAAQPGAGDHTETLARLGAKITAGADAADSPLLGCGEHDGGRTFCFSNEPLVAGEYFVIANVLEQSVPLVAAKDHLTYGIVLDADGNPDNNYVASPAYPNDWYQGTDRWFELSHSPAEGWWAGAFDASVSPIQSLPSGARIVVQDNVIALLLPAGEIAAVSPGFRVTAFAHQGDWGFELPWSGDVEPPVQDGLAALE